MKRFWILLLSVVMVFSLAGVSGATTMADFVFIIDATSSMTGEIAAVKAGLSSFVNGLASADVDARFSVVLFGGAPELVLDWTTDGSATEAAFAQIYTSGAVSGFQNNHNVNPEAGLEAIRIVLSEAVNSTLLRNNVGGTGPLTFRANARPNLILVTDEDSDLPYYTENRFPGQSGTDPPTTVPLASAWQAEVDATAQAIIEHDAFINLIINTGDSPSRWQYGNPGSSAQDADFSNFDPDATLANLIANGYGNSLEAQVLNADLIGRAFDITSINNTGFIDNFFDAKIEEVTDNPFPTVPIPGAVWLLGSGLFGLIGIRRRFRS